MSTSNTNGEDKQNLKRELIKRCAYIDETNQSFRFNITELMDFIQANYLLRSDVMEAIGEDEDEYPDLHAQIRNRYRAEIRTKLSLPQQPKTKDNI